MHGNKRKINIGCGPNGQIEGFVNIDNSPAVLLAKAPLLKWLAYSLGWLSQEKYEANWSGVRWIDAGRRLPFRDCSLDKIYSSHFLEHVPLKQGTTALRECYRILKPGGSLRLVLPDLLWHAQRYVDETRAIIAQQKEEWSREVHDRFLHIVYGGYLDKARYGLEHCYMYDAASIVTLLREIGFSDIEVFEFQRGNDPELCRYDSRPEDSLQVECRKIR